MNLRNLLKNRLKKILSSRLYDSLVSGIKIISNREYVAAFKDLDHCIKMSNFSDLSAIKAKLRQNAHILEKGCEHPEFKPGHGKIPYQKALDILKKIDDCSQNNDNTVIWARNIIKRYELMQNGNVPIYDNLTGIKETISPEEALYLFKSRKSVRKYSERQISFEIASNICLASIWAPSSCNRQTVKVYASINPDISFKCLQCCIGGTGFSKFIPAFFCFTVDIRSYQLPAECYTIQIDGALAAQNCALMAATFGISFTFLTWASHSSDSDKILRNTLNIQPYEMIILNAAAGYPITETPPQPDRKPESEIYSIIC